MVSAPRSACKTPSSSKKETKSSASKRVKVPPVELGDTDKVVESLVEPPTPTVDVEPPTPTIDVEPPTSTVDVCEAVGTESVVKEPIPESKMESIENAFISKLSSFITKISSINKEVKELQAIGKTLEKDFNNVVKVISKKKNKSKNSENKNLSGFAMPSLLSEELYDFLKIETGTRVPRKDVTRMLNDYIKLNNLRNESDRRKILPDDTLKSIFKCTDEDHVTYFNLQTYMKHHFIKEQTQSTKSVLA